MITIGHRGCGDQYPENTIRAVRDCAPHVNLIEIDVMRCGSGELIAFHDESLERVTGVNAVVAETDWETIRDLTVSNSESTIPRFEDVIGKWPEDVGLNLDVDETGIVRDALELAAERVDDILVSTTNVDVLMEYQDSPEVARSGYSFHRDVERNVDRADSFGCDFVHVPFQLCLETDLVTTAHDAGLAVDAWTVRSAVTVDALRDVGADAVTVDRWDIL